VTTIDPTEENYSAWRDAYDYFNAGLFNDRLPGCLITFQRERGAYGFHAGSQFEATDGRKADEIALNPCHFARRDPRKVLSTLVHEMTHQYQWHFGKRNHGGYHDKAWARLMIDIGLVPTDTGEPGGKATGRRVTHFIREHGPFDRLCTALIEAGFVIPFREVSLWEVLETKSNAGDPEARSAAELQRQKADRLRREKAASKSRYTCPGCEYPKHVWGKPGLHVICGECGERFAAEKPDQRRRRSDEPWPSLLELEKA
jgi:ribosomal protein S27E